MTAHSEHTTILLGLLWFYTVFMPIIFAWILTRYFGYHDAINITSTSNLFILETFSVSQNLNIGGTSFPFLIPENSYSSADFVAMMNDILRPYDVILLYDNIHKRFYFRSGRPFRIRKGSTIMRILGCDSEGIYTAKEINPFTNDYRINDIVCRVYEIVCEHKRYINDPYNGSTVGFINMFNPSNGQHYRTIAYFIFTFLVVIWKYFSVRSYRSIGKTIQGDVITDHQIEELNGVRVTFNMLALAIATIMMGYLIIITITNQDLTPLQDIHF